jgi:hypothetical protein
MILNRRSASEMARRSCTHNRADVRAQIKLLETIGKSVTAIKFHPDGTFRLMTAEHKSASPADDELDRELAEFRSRNA